MRRGTQVFLAALVAGAILATMALGIRGVPAWNQAPTPPATDPNSYEAIADAMFDRLVIPFEVLGVLLTAVMIGALVIARPLGVHGKEESALIHPNLSEPAAAPQDETAVPPAPPAPAQAPPVPAAAQEAAP